MMYFCEDIKIWFSVIRLDAESFQLVYCNTEPLEVTTAQHFINSSSRRLADHQVQMGN